jgi:transcriptional regulator with XRE-family HTH domain
VSSVLGTATELEIRKAVGARVRALRLDRGYTQQELASHAGISKHTLSGIETGRLKFDVEKYRQIAEVFGVSVNPMFEGLI